MAHRAATPHRQESSHGVVCAYDANVYLEELIAAAPLCNPETDPGYNRRRDPYAMRLRVRATGAELAYWWACT